MTEGDGPKMEKKSSGKEQFLMELPNRMLMLAAAWEDLAQKSPVESEFPEELATCMIKADSLKDVCLTKGLEAQADALAGLGEMLGAIPDVEPRLRDDHYKDIGTKISDLVAQAEKLCGEDVRREGARKPEEKAPKDPKKEKSVAVLEQTPIQIAEPVFEVGTAKARNVFVISNDEDFLGECTTQIGHYGYTAHSFHSYAAYALAAKLEEPVALIVDLDLAQKDSEIHGDLSRFQAKKDGTPVPIIVVGSSGDFESRLQAVRAGSAAFFAKPVNVSLLLDKLDAIISNAYVVEPFRVLVVEDSATMIRFITRTLTQAGMSVHVEQTPDRVLPAIADFHPDLILMDMYMPKCDGQELSRLIRQYESYTSIPIVFLSSETDVKKQLAAMQIGADDFLTKPIEPTHLVTSITTRVRRHRILSSFMVKDSLTGLLNHTKLKQGVEQSLQKAMRSKIPMAFAMVDIDFFKKVNDTYGHPMGDKVIKSLSRLLQRRLRKTDSIGRYGGEEFAVILWDTDVDGARKILDSIRSDFSKIEHIHEGKSFSCTFSSGVAGFPDYPDAQTISNAADKALYVAKRNGRNQVIVATNGIA